MNGIDYLADTNAMLYLLSGNACMGPFLTAKLGVSCITEMELLSFPNISAEEEESIRTVLSCCTVIALHTGIKERTIALRRKYRIKLPDAIIAATAVDQGVPLLSADKGFSKIMELQLKLLRP